MEVDRWAKALGGRFLLRIEDIDLARARPEFETAIYEDLAWLGLEWEKPVMRQSERVERYETVLRETFHRGLCYLAPGSRAEIARYLKAHPEHPRDPDGAPLYPFGQENRADQPHSFPETGPLRLNLQAAMEAVGRQTLAAKTWNGVQRSWQNVSCNPGVWGDVLLRGRDRPATYNLAVVLDDVDQGISHVVRGLDLEPATAVHRLLQDLLGLPAPAYHHHRLILGEDGRKLSKSEGAQSLRALREAGETPASLRALLDGDGDHL